MLPWHSLAIVASCHQDACLPWTSSWWHAALWCYCGFQWLLSHRFLHQSSKTATYTWTGCPQHGSSVHHFTTCPSAATKVWPKEFLMSAWMMEYDPCSSYMQWHSHYYPTKMHNEVASGNAFCFLKISLFLRWLRLSHAQAITQVQEQSIQSWL